MVMIATVLLNNSYVKAEDTIEVYDGVKYRVNNEQKNSHCNECVIKILFANKKPSDKG